MTDSINTTASTSINSATLADSINAQLAQLQVPIQTVSPELKHGELMVSADRRATKENPLQDHERIRRVVLSSALWDGYDASLRGSSSQGLRDMLTKALQQLAADKLRDMLSESPTLRTVEVTHFTIPALLAWQAETAASRGSLTLDRDEVLAWFETSATRAAIMTKHGNKAPAVLSFLRTRFAALAARNHGLSKPDDATKLTALIAAADLEGPAASLVAEVVQRLAHIERSLTAKLANAEAISLDDL